MLYPSEHKPSGSPKISPLSSSKGTSTEKSSISQWEPSLGSDFISEESIDVSLSISKELMNKLERIRGKVWMDTLLHIPVSRTVDLPAMTFKQYSKAIRDMYENSANIKITMDQLFKLRNLYDTLIQYKGLCSKHERLSALQLKHMDGTKLSDLSKRFYDPETLKSLACLADSIIYSLPVSTSDEEGKTDKGKEKERSKEKEREREREKEKSKEREKHHPLLIQYFKDITRLGKGNNGTVYTVDFLKTSKLFVIKAPMYGINLDTGIINMDSDAFKKPIREYWIGIHLNKIRELCPNFMFTYSFFQCSFAWGITQEIIRKTNQSISKPLNSVSSPSSHLKMCRSDNPIIYLVLENIPSNISYEDFFIDANPSEFLSLVGQILLSLQIAYEKYGFTHYDLNTGNILIRKLDRKYDIPYKLNDKTIYVSSDYIFSIIDFGASRMLIDGVSYGNPYAQVIGNNPKRSYPCHDVFRFLGSALVLLMDRTRSMHVPGRNYYGDHDEIYTGKYREDTTTIVSWIGEVLQLFMSRSDIIEWISIVRGPLENLFPLPPIDSLKKVTYYDIFKSFMDIKHPLFKQVWKSKPTFPVWECGQPHMKCPSEKLIDITRPEKESGFLKTDNLLKSYDIRLREDLNGIKKFYDSELVDDVKQFYKKHAGVTEEWVNKMNDLIKALGITPHKNINVVIIWVIYIIQSCVDMRDTLVYLRSDIEILNNESIRRPPDSSIQDLIDLETRYMDLLKEQVSLYTDIIDYGILYLDTMISKYRKASKKKTHKKRYIEQLEYFTRLLQELEQAYTYISS